MKKYTRGAFEQYLNEMLSAGTTPKQAVESYAYMKNGSILPETIERHYYKRTLGTMVRKYDPIQFNIAFNEWVRRGER